MIDERRVARLRVSHAFHSARMDPIRDELHRVAASMQVGPMGIPVLSNLTGRLLSDEMLADPGYWFAHARGAVRFVDDMATAEAMGVRVWIECGPGAVLAALAAGCQPGGVFVPSLKRDGGDVRALADGVAAAWAAGADVDPAPLCGAASRRVDLPTYPFERQSYWLPTPEGGRSLAALGLADATHTLLGAAVALADGGVVYTGRLDLAAQPWLGDHRVFGSVVVPGAVLLDIVLGAARSVGEAGVEELVIEAPLVLPDDRPLDLRVSVGPARPGTPRTFAVHTLPPDAAPVRHAAGTLGARATEDSATGLFPTTPILARRRLRGPGGDRPRVRAVVPRARGGVDGGRRPLGPGPPSARALADRVPGPPGPGRLGPPLPRGPGARVRFQGGAAPVFARPGLDCADRRDPAPGADAADWTVAAGQQGASIRAWTPDGTPVLEIGVFRARKADPASLRRGTSQVEGLYRVAWVPVPPPVFDAVAPRVAVVGTGAVVEDLGRALGEADVIAQRVDCLADIVPADVDLVVWSPDLVSDSDGIAAAHATAEALLHDVQGWVTRPDTAGTRIVVVTRYALAAGPSDVPRLSEATIPGMIRVARTEHPTCGFAHLDIDDGGPDGLVAALLDESEPDAALRGGIRRVARLRRAPAGAPLELPEEGTVLVTGGTSGLGADVARHLVTRHGARHLVLTSRRGPDSPEATRLVAELAELGGSAEVVAVDAGDRDGMRILLDNIPPERPLRVVVHSAGVLEDAVLGAVSDEQLHAVMRPKVDGATVLHELTADTDLVAFVLFSSIAGQIGSGGQASYAAANTWLDALAARRRASGLPGVSIAWGAWAGSGMAGRLHDTVLARMRRLGVRMLEIDHGLALLDASWGSPDALLVAADLDLAAFEEGQATPPRLLAQLVSRTDAVAVVASASRLREAPPETRDGLLLDEVRAIVASVLGLPDPGGVGGEPERPRTRLDDGSGSAQPTVCARRGPPVRDVGVRPSAPAGPGGRARQRDVAGLSWTDSRHHPCRESVAESN